MSRFDRSGRRGVAATMALLAFVAARSSFSFTGDLDPSRAPRSAPRPWKRPGFVNPQPGHVVVAVPSHQAGRDLAYADNARPRLAGATRARIHRLGVAGADGRPRGFHVAR